VHVCAVIPNFRITEYFVNFRDVCDEIALASLTMQAGWVDLPTVPGLGIDIDADQLRKRPYQQFPNRRMRHYWEEFPRKDYVTGAAH
jgi:galactonate dehydratase